MLATLAIVLVDWEMLSNALHDPSPQFMMALIEALN